MTDRGRVSVNAKFAVPLFSPIIREDEIVTGIGYSATPTPIRCRITYPRQCPSHFHDLIHFLP